MGYVWTAEQVSNFLDIFRNENTVTNACSVSVNFETSVEFARQVLPPCFEVPKKPTLTVSVSLIRETLKGRYQSGNACRQEEELGAIRISALRNGVEGVYSLSETVSGDFQVASGRDFWGNPKKRGNSQIYNDGQTVYAWVERMGVRIIEIDAKLGPTIPELTGRGTRGHYFTIKYDFDPEGAGLMYDPFVVVMNNGADVVSATRLENVRVTLRPNGVDPVETIVVGKMLSASLSYGGGSYLIEAVEKLDDRDTYIPYILGRIFDDVGSIPSEDARARTFTSE